MIVTDIIQLLVLHTFHELSQKHYLGYFSLHHILNELSLIKVK